MLPLRQLLASILIGLALLFLIIRLVQRGRLDIAYCWLWLAVGFGIVLVVLRYDWLLRFTTLIGAVTPTTALFLIGFLVVLAGHFRAPPPAQTPHAAHRPVGARGARG
jgi:hypothetical protein